MSASLPVVAFDALAELAAVEGAQAGVLLPPFVEPSLVVESWQACDFLTSRLGRPARVAGVSTFVDLDHVTDHMASATSLSQRGWGRNDLDARTVADIVVGQIESATELVIVGGDSISGVLARRLAALNPGARQAFAGRARDASPNESERGSFEPVVPPWLQVLQGADPEPTSDLFVYRRTRPFDPVLLDHWLVNPPEELLRGKGHVWLGSDPDQSFGYSCAGSVQRLFPAGRWWASYGEGAWPQCATQRQRLLERWHPTYGDRRQELVFLGVDLDRELLSASLDACLLPECAASRTSLH